MWGRSSNRLSNKCRIIFLCSKIFYQNKRLRGKIAPEPLLFLSTIVYYPHVARGDAPRNINKIAWRKKLCQTLTPTKAQTQESQKHPSPNPMKKPASAIAVTESTRCPPSRLLRAVFMSAKAVFQITLLSVPTAVACYCLRTTQAQQLSRYVRIATTTTTTPVSIVEG